MSTLRLTKQTLTKCIASFVRRKKAVLRRRKPRTFEFHEVQMSLSMGMAHQ